MTRRGVLGTACLVALVAGFVAAWIPFAGYLGTSDVVVERDTVTVPLAALPADGVLAIDWRDRRLFVHRNPEPMVVSVRFDDGAYQLPHPENSGALIRCAVFGPVGREFRCLDPDTPSELRERARWSLDGDAVEAGVAPLESAPSRIVGEALVIGDTAQR